MPMALGFQAILPTSRALLNCHNRRITFLPSAFATTKRELRALALGRIAEARVGHEPLLVAWLGEEMRRAAAAVLRRAA